MAHAGQTTENPLAGERFHWLLTEADTDGRLVRAEVAIRPRSGVLLRHIHPSSEERFEVLAGRMLVEIDGEQTLLVAGVAAVVPAGATHCWRNVGADELRFVVEVENPLGFEDMIEDVFAAARAGRMDANGRLELLTGAVLMRRHAANTVAVSPPRGVQRVLIPPLALLARMLRGAEPAAA
jgi:mannose-6-phosphate isomerase-like protein (cupin superfamily)